jgi:hypothetical protein
MAQTSIGAKKAAETAKLKYGSDWHAKIGRIGGKHPKKKKSKK